MARSLRERAQEFTTALPFMDGRSKADFNTLMNKVVTIRDFGFMKDSPQKSYVGFIIDEDKDSFYFGGQVLTDQIKKLDEDGYGHEIRTEGLPVRFTEKKSKNKNAQGRFNIYTAVEFYPVVEATEPPKEDKPAKESKKDK